MIKDNMITENGRIYWPFINRYVFNTETQQVMEEMYLVDVQTREIITVNYMDIRNYIPKLER